MSKSATFCSLTKPRLSVLLFFALFALISQINGTHIIADTIPEDDPNIVIHVVQRGENLFRIAQRYGLTVSELAALNAITNPSSIMVGQRLIVAEGNQSAVTAPPSAVHIVRPGENLRGIADFYGVSVDELMVLNDITDPNRIAVGQEIRVRREDEAPRPAPAIVSDAPLDLPESQITATHTIQRGETLFGIATAYGVPMSAIQAANGITSASRIFAGQQIVIPGAEAQISVNGGDLPAWINEIALNPLVLTEGKTGRLIIDTQSPATITGEFLGREINFIAVSGGLSHVAFLPVPIFTEADVYPLRIVLNGAGVEESIITLNIRVNAGNYGSQRLSLPEDQMHLLSTGVEENEMNILRNVASRLTLDRYWEGAMSLPAAAAMNSSFGARRSYNGSAFDRFHSGADFAGAPGTPILASAGGRVVLADTLNIRGSTVMIDHGWGVYTVYCHMSERLVNIGDTVRVGQIVGLVGNTGRATGAHLHWELWVNGVPVDPMQWVRERFP